MNIEPASVYRPTKPVPVRWFLVGCALILGTAAVIAYRTSPSIMILAVGGCVAWWIIFLSIVDEGYRKKYWFNFRDETKQNCSNSGDDDWGSSFDREGVSNVNGLPTDTMGIDTVGNVFGTGGSDDSSSRF